MFDSICATPHSCSFAPFPSLFTCGYSSHERRSIRPEEYLYILDHNSDSTMAFRQTTKIDEHNVVFKYVSTVLGVVVTNLLV